MIGIGHYVTYKGNNYLVVDRKDSTLKLNSPVHKRVQVNAENVLPVACKPATGVTYKDSKYIVTAFDRIFSVRTGKLMQWLPSNGDHKAIIHLAKTSS